MTKNKKPSRDELSNAIDIIKMYLLYLDEKISDIEGNVYILEDDIRHVERNM